VVDQYLLSEATEYAETVITGRRSGNVRDQGSPGFVQKGRHDLTRCQSFGEQVGMQGQEESWWVLRKEKPSVGDKKTGTRASS
jgi:hypothetical protein